MNKDLPLKIFIGYDSREDIAYQVCVHSLNQRASLPIEIKPIDLSDLRDKGIYNRKNDPLASTEFTYSRFLTPYLTGWNGWALFCDCDVLFLSDIVELFKLKDNSKAIMCVPHDHKPTEKQKMDGVPQTCYHRKNWSSVVLYNCEHPANRVLTPDCINSQTGKFLHQFEWLDDNDIGYLPESWNWLEGWSKKTDTLPHAIHYTRGGPWFKLHHTIEYADLWLREHDSLGFVHKKNDLIAEAI
jgi:lipopolysaccharide biosynthesis glycosyltransferase